MHGLPMMVSEDASAAKPRLDVAFRDGTYYLYGLCGGSIAVDSVEQLRAEVLARGVGRALYVYVLVPNAPHAVFFPVMALTTDNTDNTDDLERRWRELDELLHQNGAVGMGHVGDGAAAFRCV